MGSVPCSVGRSHNFFTISLSFGGKCPSQGRPQLGGGSPVDSIIKVKEVAAEKAKESTSDFTFLSDFSRNISCHQPLSLTDPRLPRRALLVSPASKKSKTSDLRRRRPTLTYPVSSSGEYSQTASFSPITLAHLSRTATDDADMDNVCRLCDLARICLGSCRCRCRHGSKSTQLDQSGV